MKTLILEPMCYRMNLRLKGLSIKKIPSFCKLSTELCKDECGYFIDTYFNTTEFDPNTCHIKYEYLLLLLKELHRIIPFDKIKMEGYYPITEEQMMKDIQNNNP